MRILVVTNMYPPHHFGGYELSCADTVRRFREWGHGVHVLTSDVRVARAHPDDDRILGVKRDLQIYWRDHELLSPSLRHRLSMERHNQQALRQAVDATRPDVVSVWNMGAVSFGLLTTVRRLGLPTVMVLEDEWPCYGRHLDAWSRLFRRRGTRLAGRLVQRATGVPCQVRDPSGDAACLFISECTRRAVQEHSGWSLRRSGIVYCGVDTADFPVGAEEEAVVERPWRWRLLYIGRMDERKGVHTAIRSLSYLPDACLRIVGRGHEAYLRDLRALTHELGLAERVTFSSAERSDLRTEYMAADALLFPSVYAEPFGIVPLEAMASDTPVIATGRGGSGEYLFDGDNCLLFQAESDRALAEAVLRLAGNTSLRERLVRGGRRTARGLTVEAFAERVLEWHEAARAGYAGGQPDDRSLTVGNPRISL